MNRQQVVLIILDGWGYREETKINLISEAKTPFIDSLFKQYPHSLLEASHESVGLPHGQMGNSEVGHMTIGAGRIIDTDLLRIQKSIDDGSFDNNSAFQNLFDHVKIHNSILHVKGLLSLGGVHSHQAHLYAFLKAAKNAGIQKIAIHVFTDGRDTAPQSAHTALEELENIIEEVGIGYIATASGRFYAMDRDNNWDRLKKVEMALFHNEGNKQSCVLKRPSQIMKELHEQGVMDEHLEPVVFLDENGACMRIDQNDGVFFFNFRADRARMLAKNTIDQAKEKNLCFVTMTEYDKTFDCLVAFPPMKIETTLANEISRAGLTQAHIAETEKYPHATYFLNCGEEIPHEGEEFVLIESRKDIQTHDQAPEMRAREITQKAFEFLEKGTDFIFINYANADMVGHTANKEAILIAIQTLDEELKKMVTEVLRRDGIVCISSDHGNAEQYLDESTGQKLTSHTLNPVPFILTKENISLVDGTLADITPTVLSLLGLNQPKTMTGKNLIV